MSNGDTRPASSAKATAIRAGIAGGTTGGLVATFSENITAIAAFFLSPLPDAIEPNVLALVAAVVPFAVTGAVTAGTAYIGSRSRDRQHAPGPTPIAAEIAAKIL